MNPKSVNDLDPKLKEAYDRIMGTSVEKKIDPNTSSSTANPTSSTPFDPTTQPPSPPIMQTQTVNPADQKVDATQIPMPSNQDANPVSDPNQPPISVFTQSPTTQTPQATHKKKNSFLPIVAFIGGTIFFVVYAVVWAKVFGLF